MAPKYEIGQKVIISPVKTRHLCPKDSRLEPYEGMTAEVTDLYWINTALVVPKVCYIYRVRIEDNGKEVVVHEDEIKARSRGFWKTMMSKES